VTLELLAAEGLAPNLVLVGDGPERARLEERAASGPLAGRVRITGWLSEAEVRGELRRARVVVQPSFAEGLPVALMEALALERPVVATWVAGVPELVSDGACGWLVPPGSARALATALGAALRAPLDTLRRMGRAGAQRVTELHRLDSQAARLAELIQQASAPRPGGP